MGSFRAAGAEGSVGWLGSFLVSGGESLRLKPDGREKRCMGSFLLFWCGYGGT